MPPKSKPTTTTRRSSARESALQNELRAVAAAKSDPSSSESRALLISALDSSFGHVVAVAATIIREHGLPDLAPALVAAWSRLLPRPIATDPGCHAKLALLDALDFAEHAESAPFVAGTRVVQMEPAWGPPVDTAGGVRARAILALARLSHDDLSLFAGELLGDALAIVRTAAADALAHSGDRTGAGLLLLALHTPDPDPLVRLACMRALVTLAPDVAMTKLRPALSGDDPSDRELVAIAFGQSGRRDAVDALIEELGACVRSADREPLLRALGLSRSDAALDALVEVVGSTNIADAEAAVTALAPRRFERSVRTRVEEAAGDRARLVAHVRDVLGDGAV